MQHKQKQGQNIFKTKTIKFLKVNIEKTTFDFLILQLNS